MITLRMRSRRREMMMKQAPPYNIKRMWVKDAGKGRAEQVSVS
jgi:hypothetical protein